MTGTACCRIAGVTSRVRLGKLDTAVGAGGGVRRSRPRARGLRSPTHSVGVGVAAVEGRYIEGVRGLDALAFLVEPPIEPAFSQRDSGHDGPTLGYEKVPRAQEVVLVLLVVLL